MPTTCVEKQNGRGCKYNLFTSVFDIITEQEEEIEQLKSECEYRKKRYDNQVSENTRLYIEYDKLKDDYAKRQEQFAQYQMASDKEIKAQVKQAVKDFAKRLKKCSYCDNDFMDGKWHRYVLVSDIDKLLEEYEK